MRNEKGQFIKGHRIGMTGKHHTSISNTKNRVSHLGKSNRRLGKKHSPEAIKKIREARKIQGNNVWNRGKKLHYKVWNKGLNKTNNGVLRKMSIDRTGERNPVWQGGISFIPYTIDWTETLRRSIRERDNYICQICSQYGNAVHHKDYDKKNCNPDNLITLCQPCHNKTNVRREFWKRYFYENK